MIIPQPITLPEWQEIMALPRIQQIWDLDGSETVEAFASNLLGVKFIYTTHQNEEQSSVYIISSGDADSMNALVKRTNGMLIVEE